MWSELKRVASLGDAEDYAHVNLRTRTQLSAEIVFDGGVLPGSRQPSFELHGELGRFTVMPGETSGTLVAVAPGHRFPRRRSSVRTPSLADMHEDIPVVCERVSLPPGTRHGPSAFWKCVYDAVRTAAAIPFSIDDSIEALKFSNLMKKASPFGK
jgi:hypothetical protein